METLKFRSVLNVDNKCFKEKNIAKPNAYTMPHMIGHVLNIFL